MPITRKFLDPTLAPTKPVSINFAKQNLCIARAPYLNSAPFFRGFPLASGYEFIDEPPRQAGIRAAAGELTAGLLPLADYLRLSDTFERLGPFGIAVRGRAHSVTLFSRKPIRQLDGAWIAVTEETSTTAVLLRLLLEQRYGIVPTAYERGMHYDTDALALIGDEALRFRHTNTQYPFEIDLAFEWWLWQHLPCVFAVWAIRKDADPQQKRALELALSGTLGKNLSQLDAIAKERSESLGIPAEELHSYLGNFIYRLSQPEEDAIRQFQALTESHHVYEEKLEMSKAGK